MKKIIYTFLIVKFVFIGSLFAQVTQQWVARYNGPGNNIDMAYSLAVDGSGNVYVTGESTGNGTGNDYATIKYNSAGVQQWVARYNGPGNSDDMAYSIVIDGSGNVYVTGISIGSGTGYDYATIKYNSAGVQQWVARYNGPGNSDDMAYSIVIDNSGNVYVTGISIGSGTGYDYTTIKYNSAGVQQWVARYNGPGNNTDGATSLAVDNSGNVYVTGYSIGSGPGYDYATIKYNSAGTQQWASRYNGPGNNDDRATSIGVDISGNVYVTGYSTGSGTGYDYATIKYYSSGAQLWVSRYNGPGNNDDRATSIGVDIVGNAYVTGYSTGSGTGLDYATIKYNSSGTQQWVSRYNGPGNGNDYANSLAIDGYGNIYVTGESPETVTYRDYATIKYNNSGAQQWTARYNGPGNHNDKAFSIAVDGSGKVYVTGYSRSGSGTGTEDYATIKYTQVSGIKNTSTEVPSSFSLEQNYPNPFNSMTNVKWSILNAGNVRITVFDILGKEVTVLVNQRLQAGTYEVRFDGSGLASGIYYYKIEAGEFKDIKKMILIK